MSKLKHISKMHQIKNSKGILKKYFQRLKVTHYKEPESSKSCHKKSIFFKQNNFFLNTCYQSQASLLLDTIQEINMLYGGYFNNDLSVLYFLLFLMQCRVRNFVLRSSFYWSVSPSLFTGFPFCIALMIQSHIRFFDIQSMCMSIGWTIT